MSTENQDDAKKKAAAEAEEEAKKNVSQLTDDELDNVAGGAKKDKTGEW